MKPIKSTDIVWILVIAMLLAPVITKLVDNLTIDKQSVLR